MRFIPESIYFERRSVTTGHDQRVMRASYLESVVLKGVFDMFTEAKLRGELVLNDAETLELQALVGKVAARYNASIQQQVLSEVKAELKHGN